MPAQPPQIVNLPADNSIVRGVRVPMLIVAHDTEGVDSRATLQHGDGRGVSIHGLIQKFPRHDGSTDVAPGLPHKTAGALIYRMVPDTRGANHAGYSTWTHNGVTYGPGRTNVNVISLGFELECLGSRDPSDHYTDDQLLCAGFLINDWRAKYGPLPIVRHADIDPGRRSDTYHLTIAELEKWANAAALVYGSTAARRYIVQGVPVYERSDHTGKLWGRLMPGQVVVIDDLTNGHVAQVDGVVGGIGFVDMQGLEPLP